MDIDKELKKHGLRLTSISTSFIKEDGNDRFTVFVHDSKLKGCGSNNESSRKNFKTAFSEALKDYKEMCKEQNIPDRTKAA